MTGEASFLSEILGQLAASGPLAVTLGFACWTLWRSNREKDDKIEQLHSDHLETLRGIRDAINSRDPQ